MKKVSVLQHAISFLQTITHKTTFIKFHGEEGGGGQSK